MKCDVCGADPMTANCNNANCDTGKPRKCRNCDATAPDWSGNGLCITCARDEVSNTTEAELDEILNRLHQQYEMVFGMHKKPIDMTKVKQAILDWHNKQVDEILKDEQHDNERSVSAFKYMWRNKLKGQS